MGPVERERRIVIGWREFVALPDWGVPNLHAKIDTGARTSAIHVDNLEVLDAGRIRFDVVLHRTERHRHIPVEATVVRKSRVTSSNGTTQERFFVKTLIRLGPVEKVVELSLVDRDNMHARMLIGRTALGQDFLIDAHATNLLGKPAP